jgi:hypothetical protein
MKRTLCEAAAATVLSLVVALPTIVSVRAQSKQAMPDLVGALKSTPGVLGVEAAQTMSGKQAIFAWFENKKAVLAWYYSDTHQSLMLQFTGGVRRPEGPLVDVPDDGRPILAIASLKMAPNAGEPKDAGELRTSVTQIAIELYAPLPGGLAVGGRFAPSTVAVPGMLEVPVEALAAIGPR